MPNQAGQGGALAVVGAATPAVVVKHVNFTENLALTASKKSSSYAKSQSLSLGGALSIALSSNITIFKGLFSNNLAYNGAGNDMSSISGQTNQENFVHSTDCIFAAGTKAGQSALVQDASVQANQICDTVKGYVDKAKNVVISYQQGFKSSSGGGGGHHINIMPMFTPAYDFHAYDRVHSSFDNIHDLAEPSAHSLFPVSADWHQNLRVSDTTSSSSSSSTSSSSNGKGFLAKPANKPADKDQRAEAVKVARWQYLQHRDSSLLSLPGARKRVNFIVNQLLRLDLWLQERGGSDAEEVTAAATVKAKVEEGEGPRIHTGQTRREPTYIQYTTLGRRSKPSSTASTTAGAEAVNSLLRLEKAYRTNLMAELDAEFLRLELEQKSLARDKAAASEGGQKETTFTPDNPAAALLNFHPYVVITSGRAYFENPTFQGVYHMFFGDFPQIAQYSYNDNYITNSIVAVPSYSAIFGHITQEDLTLTAITASIEIFDSNDKQEYGVRQINLFNATLQLNRNVTVTGSSFVTGSLITSVNANTSSLIPYVDGGDKYPTVTFQETLFTGVSLKSVLSTLGSVFDRNDDNSANTTVQTLVTISSVS